MRQLRAFLFTDVPAFQDFKPCRSELKSFVWTADPGLVLAAVKRGKQLLEWIHSGAWPAYEVGCKHLTEP
jgi:hypothetical protein